MTDVNIRGEWLKLGRSLVFKDGGGVTWTLSNGNEISVSAVSGASIPPGSVSNTELANMAQDTIKGRADGAGTGSPQDLTASQEDDPCDQSVNGCNGHAAGRARAGAYG